MEICVPDLIGDEQVLLLQVRDRQGATRSATNKEAAEQGSLGLDAVHEWLLFAGWRGLLGEVHDGFRHRSGEKTCLAFWRDLGEEVRQVRRERRSQESVGFI